MFERLQQRWMGAWRTMGAVLGGAAVAAACGGGGGGDTATGTLRVALTDAPACGFDNVYVTIEKVRVHRSASAADGDAGWSELLLATPRRVDLLTLTNGVLSELGELPLEAGKYTQMRLALAANTASDPLANAVVPTGGIEQPLTTPSGQQTGTKLNVDIDIAAGQMADVVLDFDACKSVVHAGASGHYILKPVVRAMPRLVSGVLGHVDGSLAGASASLQQDGTVVRSTVADGSGRFLLQPVGPGSYDLVVTVAGHATTVITGVTVTADTVTTVNDASSAFAPPESDGATADGGVTSANDVALRATQLLAAGTTIEVAATTIASGASYSFTLPVGAPLVATYGSSPLAFAADGGAAGKYTIEATSNGTTKTAGPLALAGGTTVTNDFMFP
jgi:hypothetical protein